MFFVLSLIVIFFILFYIFLTWNFNYWKKRGVLGPSPIPLAGSFPKSFFQYINCSYDIDEAYRKYKSVTPFIGYFTGTTPGLILLDPKLIKDVLISNFKHFYLNHFAVMMDKSSEPILSRSPFFITDPTEWKDKRTELAPAFTHSKIKLMYPTALNVCNQMTKFLTNEFKINQLNEIDGFELAVKYCTDYLISTLYGLESNSFSSDETSIFLKHTSGLMDRISSIKLAVYCAFNSVFPFLPRIHKTRMLRQSSMQFFSQILKQAIKIRETDKNPIDDYLNYLIKIQKKKNLKLVDLEANMATVYFDGIATSAQMLALNLYCLARNPKAQDKLRNEINRVITNNRKSNNTEEITYDNLIEMEYLDNVFNETLRMIPDQPAFTKLCTEKTTFRNYNNDDVVIDEGMTIMIPIYSLHHDPEYFPNPHEFRPERFDAEFGGAEGFRKAGTYFPWGDGPRVCLGMRYATLQVKSGLVEIIRRFYVENNSKTSDECIFDPSEIGLFPTGGIWINLKPIEQIT